MRNIEELSAANLELGLKINAQESFIDGVVPLRADPSRARDSGGSGLGLAVVKSIVEAHGGGMFFWFRLPAIAS